MKKILVQLGWLLGVTPIVMGFKSVAEGFFWVSQTRDYFNEEGVLVDRSPQPDKPLGFILLLGGSIQFTLGMIWLVFWLWYLSQIL